MRTTLEIPDALFKQAKLTAVHEGVPLKTIVTRALAQSLNSPPSHKRPSAAARINAVKKNAASRPRKAKPAKKRRPGPRGSSAASAKRVTTKARVGVLHAEPTETWKELLPSLKKCWAAEVPPGPLTWRNPENQRILEAIRVHDARRR